MATEKLKGTKVHTRYKTQDGTPVVGVTTALQELSKPALIFWSWNLGMQNIDYRKFRDKLGVIGTITHDMVLCHQKKTKPDLSEYSPEEIDLAENAFISYLEWEKNKVIEPILLEHPMVSEIFKFGGSLDCYAKIDGVLTLCDYKTSKAIYPEHFYQVSAYLQLLYEHGHKVEQVRILQIGRDSTEGFSEQVKNVNDMELYWKIFRSCLDIYNYKKQLKNGSEVKPYKKKSAKEKLNEVGL